MIQHVVFFKFKPETTDEQIDAIADGLSGLPDSIEEVRGFVFGRDVIRSERSYDFALVSTFDDLEALDRYQVHPEHQKVVALVKAAAESVVAVDFEI
ncbi:MAG: stress responsive alpha-beta barrel domain-containing protein [Desulfuromonas sp.]|nr:MAG: stress responsive alpha-beta barrel domain-containing protein [Desulfuromonas sp.]